MKVNQENKYIVYGLVNTFSKMGLIKNSANRAFIRINVSAMAAASDYYKDEY